MGQDTRRPHRYRDPVDLLWLRAARELGLSLSFSDDVFASYDGRGTRTLCHAAHYDPDDSLAQLVFHELCHALVAGRLPGCRRSRRRCQCGATTRSPTCARYNCALRRRMRTPTA